MASQGDGVPSLGALLMEIAKPQSRAWRKGYAAYGVGERDNPCVQGRPREDWFNGFNHARAVGMAAVAIMDEPTPYEEG